MNVRVPNAQEQMRGVASVGHASSCSSYVAAVVVAAAVVAVVLVHLPVVVAAVAGARTVAGGTVGSE